MAKVRGFKRRLEPFGATQARGKQYAATRKLQNRIHELEQQVVVLERREAHAHAKVMEAERLARDAQPTAVQVVAMEAFARLPAMVLLELEQRAPGIVAYGIELGKWALRLRGTLGVCPKCDGTHRSRAEQLACSGARTSEAP